jgi:glycosyltransferase involved in cell wall biosynthesis
MSRNSKSTDRPRVVGTNPVEYKSYRNFVGLPLEKYTYRRAYSLLTAPPNLACRLLHCRNPFGGLLHGDLGCNRYDLLHFFFTISMGKTPWLVSFSDFVPRWRIHTERAAAYGIKLLAAASCRQLVAISAYAYHAQSLLLEQYPNYRQAIISKMRVMHPPQPLIVHDYAEKTLDDKQIVFTFVGNDFFRKGGSELLCAVSRLINKGYPIRLNIISNMSYGDYITHTTKADLAEVQTIIQRYPKHIHQYSNLMNAEVLICLKNTHVALLPTLEDAYGYSVLEAQAAGCPVITTNVKALPEINNFDVGWLLEFPMDEWFGLRALNGKSDARQALRDLLTDSLYETMRNIIENPGLIRQKGQKCLQRISQYHDPHSCARKLEKLYDCILNDE